LSRSKTPKGVPAPTRFAGKRRSSPVEPRPYLTSRARRANSRSFPLFEVVITTYNRPERLMLLLRDIETHGRGLDVRVRVYDDASTADYSKVKAFLQTRRQQFIRAGTRHNKRKMWRWMNRIFADTRKVEAHHFLFLQDDVRLCADFFRKVQSAWEGLPDKKGTLNLHRDASRAYSTTGCWTGAQLTRMGEVSLTGWTDCAAFVCSKEAMQDLGWKLNSISDDRWKECPGLSTGIGQQISVRLHSRGWGLYRTEQSLVVHTDSVSQLNPHRRDSMQTVNFVDGDDESTRLEQRVGTQADMITASLATIPGRRRSLKGVVRRLLPQVDRLNVYLNRSPAMPGGDEYPRLPDFLKHPKICALWSCDTPFGDQGDAGKYFWSSAIKGYHIICDDDVLYPPDFIALLVAAVDKYRQKAVVGFHGAILTEPFQQYYGSRRTFHFGAALGEDVPVHIVAGAGGVAFHTSTLKVCREDFKHPNMGDIWFGLLAQKQKVPLICLEHPSGWLVDDVSTRDDSIYVHSTGSEENWRNTADVQTRVVKENMPWRVRSADGEVVLTVEKCR